MRRVGDLRQARRRPHARTGRALRRESRSLHARDHQGGRRRAVEGEALRQDPRHGTGDRGLQGPSAGRERILRPDGRRIRRRRAGGALGRRHAVAAVEHRGRDRGDGRAERRRCSPRSFRAFLVLLCFPLGMYAALRWLVFLPQRSQIYFPVPESRVAPAESLQAEVDGARIKVWAVRRPGPAAVLYFGGNAEDVAASVAPLAAALPAHSMYFVNYRGYGGSTGSPSEQALVADAIALHDR